MGEGDMETAISVTSDGLVLEALLHRVPGNRGVVVAHPHTLYGGDMHNPVVESVCRVYRAMNYSTLRFNFRGAGGSEGRFADGLGERRDLLGMLSFFRDAGINTVHLVGYSFGAWVLAGMKNVPADVVAQVHIAPPVALLDYSGIEHVPGLRLVVSGEYDELGPPTLVEAHLPAWNALARLRVVSGGDHFFSSTLKALTKILLEDVD